MGVRYKTHPMTRAPRFLLLAALLAVASALPSFEQDVVGRRSSLVCGCHSKDCTLSGIANGGLGACSATVKSGAAACLHTCDSGFTVGTGVTCTNGLLSGGVCTPKNCDASKVFQIPAGATAGTCTGTVTTGASADFPGACNVVCGTGNMPATSGKCFAEKAVGQPSCKTQVCSSFTTAVSAAVSGNNCKDNSAVGTTCTPTCKTGYDITSVSKLWTCTAGNNAATWVGTPQCIAKKCTVTDVWSGPAAGFNAVNPQGTGGTACVAGTTATAVTTCTPNCAANFQVTNGKCVLGTWTNPTCTANVCSNTKASNPTVGGGLANAMTNFDVKNTGTPATPDKSSGWTCSASSAVGATCAPKCKTGYTVGSSITCGNQGVANGIGQWTATGGVTATCTETGCTGVNFGAVDNTVSSGRKDTTITCSGGNKVLATNAATTMTGSQTCTATPNTAGPCAAANGCSCTTVTCSKGSVAQASSCGLKCAACTGTNPNNQCGGQAAQAGGAGCNAVTSHKATCSPKAATGKQVKDKASCNNGVWTAATFEDKKCTVPAITNGNYGTCVLGTRKQPQTKCLPTCDKGYTLTKAAGMPDTNVDCTAAAADVGLIPAGSMPTCVPDKCALTADSTMTATGCTNPAPNGACTPTCKAGLTMGGRTIGCSAGVLSCAGCHKSCKKGSCIASGNSGACTECISGNMGLTKPTSGAISTYGTCGAAAGPWGKSKWVQIAQTITVKEETGRFQAANWKTENWEDAFNVGYGNGLSLCTGGCTSGLANAKTVTEGTTTYKNTVTSAVTTRRANKVVNMKAKVYGTTNVWTAVDAAIELSKTNPITVSATFRRVTRTINAADWVGYGSPTVSSAGRAGIAASIMVAVMAAGWLFQ